MTSINDTIIKENLFHGTVLQQQIKKTATEMNTARRGSHAEKYNHGQLNGFI